MGIRKAERGGEATTAFGSIVTASFTTVLGSASSKLSEVGILGFTNNTDVDVLVSDDATNNLLTVPSGSSVVLDLLANSMSFSGVVALKAVGANATSGNFYSFAVMAKA